MSSILSSFLFLCLVSAALSANEPNCGTKGPNWPETARIIGGEEAKPHEFPWMCSLQLNDSKRNWCGATILNKRWLLTAGHCGQSLPSDYEVLCGAHKLFKPEGTEVRVKVDQIIFPKDFVQNKKIINDVALVKLDQNLPLDDPQAHLGSVCIPDAEPLDRLVGKSCIVTGWGRINPFNGDRSPVLKKVSLRVWKQNDCKKRWKAYNNRNISDKMLCLGEGNESACLGDSGGPANCFNEAERRWYSYGVTSFVGNKLTCTSRMPNVDARVSAYSKWIWDTIEHN